MNDKTEQLDKAFETEQETILDSGTALTAISRAEIDIQISTAHAYPRSISRFRDQALALATLDEDTAGSMFYVLPRDGRRIEGPSARLAEVVGSSWGNLRYGARIVSIDADFVTAQGACHDLETNNAITVEVKRRIRGKTGKRFNDDMIQVTANAACSIALRQAIFKIVPFAFVKPIYEAARLTSIGKAKSMREKRHAALDWFKKAGATEDQVFEFLAKQGIEEITDDDLITLRGLVTAIKEGDTTIEEALGIQHAHGSKVSVDPLNEKLAAKANGAKPKTNGKPAEEKPATKHEPNPDSEPTEAQMQEADLISAIEEEARRLGCPEDKLQAVVTVAKGEQDPQAFIQRQTWRPARGERGNPKPKDQLFDRSPHMA